MDFSLWSRVLKEQLVLLRVSQFLNILTLLFYEVETS